MINFKNRGIFLGMALLGATALTGFNSPASAKPDHDKDVRDQRWDRKDDDKDRDRNDRDRNDRDRRDNNGRWDRDDRDNNGHDNGRWPKNSNNNGRWGRDDRDDRWDRNDRNHNGRDDRWDRNDNGRWDRNDRPGNYGGYNGGRPGYGGYYPGNGGYNGGRPGGNYGGNNATSLDGIVTNDLSGNDFLVRLSNGREIKVYAQRGEPGSVSRGDTVRVSGRYSGSTFLADRVTVVRNR